MKELNGNVYLCVNLMYIVWYLGYGVNG
jgi:hypothetical protein